MSKGWPSAVGAGIVLLAGLAASPSFAAPPRPEAGRPARDAAALEAAFDDYMQAAVRNAQFSGTVLVAKDGAPVFRRSYGMASHELNVPNTGETTYQLLSITKPFTAILIMQLQAQGLLNIDDPACDYLADCPAAWQAVTVRHLLTHTSGIESYSRLPDWDETLDARTYGRAGAAALMRDHPLLSEPGTRYRYSNTGYDLLGLIVERVSGKPLGQMYRDRILGPAGMSHSGFNVSRLVVPNAATGYYSLGSTFISATPQSPTASYGSSGIFSTVDDLLLWDQALYDGRILSAESYARMIADAQNNYGLGWEMRTWSGRREVGHAGSGAGFSTMIARFIDDRLTVIVLSNSDAANAGAAARDLAAIWFGETPRAPAPDPKTRFLDAVLADGVEAATRLYREMKADQPTAEAFQTDELLVDAGYDLHGTPLMEPAKAVFDFALEQFPRSAYAHDGLADVALAEGRHDEAVRHFDASLVLDPTNDYAVAGLERVSAARPR